ncbi:MAG: hypothetical protein FJ135_10950 [Deltaproteobacteria bacterium]|nr:hypothetical protein [Deltaproteobacteria bacterium]
MRDAVKKQGSGRPCFFVIKTIQVILILRRRLWPYFANCPFLLAIILFALIFEALFKVALPICFKFIIFNLSIRENLRLGHPDATDGKIEAAARAAEIHEAIREGSIQGLGGRHAQPGREYAGQALPVCLFYERPAPASRRRLSEHG